MDFIEFFGFVGAFFIGLIMGVLGGGGSILAVPILAYIFHFDENKIIIKDSQYNNQ